jgi:hypothetical protein
MTDSHDDQNPATTFGRPMATQTELHAVLAPVALSAWFDEPVEHEKLSQKLEGYVGRSPWLPNEPLFPRAWATRSTTSWAVSSVVDFIAYFSAASGILDRVVKYRDRLTTASRSR